MNGTATSAELAHNGSTVRRRLGQNGAPVVGGRQAAKAGLPAPSLSRSSFFSVPTAVLTGVGVLPPLTTAAARYIYNGVAGQPQGQPDAPAHALAAGLLTGDTAGANTSISAPIWVLLTTRVFRSSCGRSAGLIAAAAVLNHARRALGCGRALAGFFALRPDPAEDWRLVLARPDVFLEAVLLAAEGRGGGVGGGVGRGAFPAYLLRAALEKRLWDVLAGGLAALFLAADEASPPQRPSLQSTLRRRGRDIAAVVFVVWLLSCIEFALAQASTAVAIAYGLYAMTLAGGKTAHPRLLVAMLQRHAPAAALVAWLHLIVYPAASLAPLVGRAGLGCAVRHRRVGVLASLAVGGAAMYVVLRYRSRLYIAIETSGLFVFLGNAGVVALLAVGSWAGEGSDTATTGGGQEAHKGTEGTDERGKPEKVP